MLFTLFPVLLLILYLFRCFQKFPLFAGTSYTLWTRSMEATKMGHSQGLVTVGWFAFLFFLSRFCMMFAAGYTESDMYFPIATMILVMVALLFVNVQPFKENCSHFTSINVCHVLLLALCNTCFIGTRRASFSQWLYFIMVVVIIIFPLLYISAIVLHWMYSQRKLGTDVIAKSRAWRNGYDVSKLACVNVDIFYTDVVHVAILHIVIQTHCLYLPSIKHCTGDTHAASQSMQVVLLQLPV